jgi:hypothetical protein
VPYLSGPSTFYVAPSFFSMPYVSYLPSMTLSAPDSCLRLSLQSSRITCIFLITYIFWTRIPSSTSSASSSLKSIISLSSCSSSSFHSLSLVSRPLLFLLSPPHTHKQIHSARPCSVQRQRSTDRPTRRLSLLKSASQPCINLPGNTSRPMPGTLQSST